MFNRVFGTCGCYTDNTESGEVEVDEWANGMCDATCSQELTDAEIVERVLGEGCEEGEADDDLAGAETDIVTHTDGTAALETALRYVEQQPEATTADILLVKRWRDIASRKRASSVKQKKITSFFTPTQGPA